MAEELTEFEALRRRAKRRGIQSEQRGTQQVRRRFAALGGLESGAAITQERLAREGAQAVTSEELADIRGREIAEQRRIREIGEQREFQAGEAEKQRGFISGESALGRKFQAGETARGREFAAGESALGRTFAAGESALGRTLTREEAEKQRGFVGGEAAKGREFQAKESELGRALTKEEAAKQRIFQSAEAERSRTSTEEIAKQDRFLRRNIAQAANITNEKQIQATLDIAANQLDFNQQQARVANKQFADNLAVTKAKLAQEKGLEEAKIALSKAQIADAWELGLQQLGLKEEEIDNSKEQFEKEFNENLKTNYINSLISLGSSNLSDQDLAFAADIVSKIEADGGISIDFDTDGSVVVTPGPVPLPSGEPPDFEGPKFEVPDFEGGFKGSFEMPDFRP